MTTISQDMRRATISRLVRVMRDTGSWSGETHIQKCVYFMQALLNVQMGYNFVLYKHGPYSFDLREELAAMMSSLELDVESRYPYGPSFVVGPRAVWDVKLSRQEEYAIKFVGENISIQDIRSLERLSTALLLQIDNPSQTDQEIATQINMIKPHITIPDANLAITKIAQLRAKMADDRGEG